ncbi:MAG: tetratricopeptide repeat protein [Vicinamibacterales bacterium]
MGLAICLAAITLAYANHWSNPFQFDDDHTIVQNPAIRSLSGVPRLLTDARAASVLPTHAVYRPVTYLTLAFDYALGGGLEPWAFHASTFAAFLGLVAVVFVVARHAMRDLDAGVRPWAALGAATLYGLHPVAADTVNYIIQRAEVWSALGTAGAVAVYAGWPAARRYGLFIVPGVLGILAKTTPASIFPLLVLLYATVVERQKGRRPWVETAVAGVAAGAALGLCAAMTYGTQSFDPGAPPRAQYLWTQPWIVLRYAGNMVFPHDLSIDPGWAPLASPLEARAIAGMAGLAVIVGAAVWCAWRRDTAAIGFGLAWFLVTLLPVSVFPLAEVTNDHRMFLPLAGACMAAAAAAARIATRQDQVRAVAGAAVLVMALAAAGTWQRNQVWSSHERVWADAVAKNPDHGRARMNLGVALMARGAMADAEREFDAAVRLSPTYALAHVNLGIVRGAVGRPVEAERAFARALELAPDNAVVSSYYGDWLLRQGRVTEAIVRLEYAVARAPGDMMARHRLLEALGAHRDFARLAEAARDTLRVAPGDAQAAAALDAAERGNGDLAAVRAAVMAAPTAEGWLDLSLRLYNIGDFHGSLAAATEATRLRPEYAEAFNNIAAAHAALQEWAPAVAAAERALALKPDFPLARNNLAWARAQRDAAR